MNVKIIKELPFPYNSERYPVGKIIDVGQTCDEDEDYFLLYGEGIDYIPKNCTEKC